MCTALLHRIDLLQLPVSLVIFAERPFAFGENPYCVRKTYLITRLSIDSDRQFWARSSRFGRPFACHTHFTWASMSDSLSLARFHRMFWRNFSQVDLLHPDIIYLSPWDLRCCLVLGERLSSIFDHRSPDMSRSIWVQLFSSTFHLLWAEMWDLIMLAHFWLAIFRDSHSSLAKDHLLFHAVVSDFWELQGHQAWDSLEQVCTPWA